MIDVTSLVDTILWRVKSDPGRVWDPSDQRYLDNWPADARIIEVESETALANYLRQLNLIGPVQPDPTTEERVEAAETIIDLLLMEGE